MVGLQSLKELQFLSLKGRTWKKGLNNDVKGPDHLLINWKARPEGLAETPY